MQTKLKSFFKNLSLTTSHPDSDWMKVFGLLFIICVISLVWNVYFFIAVKRDLNAVSNSAQIPVPVKGNAEEERTKAVIKYFDAQAAAHDAIIKEAPRELADPANA